MYCEFLNRTRASNDNLVYLSFFFIKMCEGENTIANHSECGRFPPSRITKTRLGAIIKGSRPSSQEESSPILLHAQEEPLPLVIVVCLGLLWLWVFCRYVLQKMILWSTILTFSLFSSSFYTPIVSKYYIVEITFAFCRLWLIYDKNEKYYCTFAFSFHYDFLLKCVYIEKTP